MTEVQTALEVQGQAPDPIQNMKQTPFLQRTMYPISPIFERFDKLTSANKDKARAKKIQNLKVRFTQERMIFNTEIFELDRKAEQIVEKFRKTGNHKYILSFEKVCNEMNQLYWEWNDTDLTYNLQQLEIEIFGNVRLENI